MVFFSKYFGKVLFQEETSQCGEQLGPETVLHMLGISNSQLIGSLTMKRVMKSVCLKLKRDALESQLN